MVSCFLQKYTINYCPANPAGFIVSNQIFRFLIGYINIIIPAIGLISSGGVCVF
nr:MAG TPA: hypothetical protein [Caudoviricetes sp.]